ncbi:MAG: hypothetical protein EXR30_00250 [Betaproteobacteria bacterium]|nr:hypothetical protein [Betaproteobacteria bacterium]
MAEDENTKMMTADTQSKRPEPSTLDRLGRFSKVPNSQAATAALELAQEVYRVSSAENADDTTVENRLNQAVELLEQVQEILNPLTVPLDRLTDTLLRTEVEKNQESLRACFSDYERKIAPEARLWHFPNAQWGLNPRKDNRDNWFVNREQLAPLCVEYVATPWLHSNSLDCILVHAFVYAETLGCGLSIRPAMIGMTSFDAILHPLKPGEYEKKTVWRGLTEVIWELAWFLLFVAVGVAAWIDTNRWWLGVAIGMGLIFVRAISYGLDAREINRARAMINDLLTEMQTISKQIATSPCSLLFLRERLLATAGKGTVWDGAVFAILDKAIQREKISW